MRTYVIVSAVFFSVITAGQLIRFSRGWPVIVAGYDVPTWVSGLAAALAGSLAVWGMRLVIKSRPTSTVG